LNFVIINLKSSKQSPVILTQDEKNRFTLKKEDEAICLETLDVTADHILPNVGSSIGNVLFVLENGFQIDTLLAENTETGVFKFKEPEQVTNIDVTKIGLGANEVLTFYFDNVQVARRFIDKKIFGEITLLNTADDSFIFYPQLKEAYLFDSTTMEIGIIGFLDCGSTLTTSSATLTELTVEPTDKKLYTVDGTSIVFELPVRSKFRLDLTADSGMNVIRMIRAKRELTSGNDNKCWQLQDELMKIFVCKE
jgi:hypothetical protein